MLMQTLAAQQQQGGPNLGGPAASSHSSSRTDGGTQNQTFTGQTWFVSDQTPCRTEPKRLGLVLVLFKSLTSSDSTKVEFCLISSQDPFLILSEGLNRPKVLFECLNDPGSQVWTVV